MPKYAIVEFADDSDIAIVATTWLFEDDNGKMFCHCLPLAQLSRAAEKCLPPQQTWKDYECRQLYSTGMSFEPPSNLIYTVK